MYKYLIPKLHALQTFNKMSLPVKLLIGGCAVVYFVMFSAPYGVGFGLFVTVWLFAVLEMMVRTYGKDIK